MKKRMLALIMALAMSASMMACGSSSSATEAPATEAPATEAAATEGSGNETEAAAGDLGGQEPVTLKLSSSISVGAPGDLAANDFKAAVEEKTGGVVTIDYYPANQLGTSDEVSEQLLEGTIDLNWQTLTWYSALQKDWNVLDLGFSVGSREQVLNFLASEKEAEIEQKLLEEDGIRILANNGVPNPRVLVTNFPVQTAEDLAGVNMRVPTLALYTKTWQAVGVNCITLDSGDVYMGFKDGMIVATEFPLGSIYSNSYHEVAKYVTYTNHLYSIYSMAVNENSWQNKLTEETRAIIAECAQEACQKYVEYDEISVSESVEKMVQAGVTINETPDLDSFTEKLADTAAQCEAEGLWSEGLYEFLQGCK